MSPHVPVRDVKSVRDLRGQLGLTQIALAGRLGVHPMTVSKWERGVSKPSEHARIRMFRLYGQNQGAGTTGERAELEPPTDRLGGRLRGVGEPPSGTLLHHREEQNV